MAAEGTALRWSMRAEIRRIGPRRFVATVRSRSSSANGLVRSVSSITPALLISTSSSGWLWTTVRATRAMLLGSVMSKAIVRMPGLAAGNGFQVIDTPARDDHGVPQAVQRLGQPSTDAAPAAGDEDGSSVEVHRA